MTATSNYRALKAIREQRGLALPSVATFTAIAVSRLQEFEDGEREPSRKQSEKLANAYGVPLYTLFNRGIPQLPALPRDFRKRVPTPAALSPRGVKSILSSERISQFTKQLANELRYRPLDLSESALKANSTKRKASKLREAFDEWLEPRASKLAFIGQPESKFLSALKLFFEIQGGVANVNSAPAEDYMGFFVTPQGGFQTIFVNRSVSSKKAQLFTFTHEYCHALMGEDGISNPFFSMNSVERSCNVFAAEFLAPMDVFSRLIEALPRSTRIDVDTFIQTASSRTLLSKHATGIRLLEGDYITQAQFRAWRRLFISFPKREKEEEQELSPATSGGAPHAKSLSEVGHLSVFLAKQAIEARFIEPYDVVQGLGLSASLQQRAFLLASRRFEVALG